MQKMQNFLENARLLNQKMGIVPLLYGSLGLEYLTGEDFHADDVDMLIPGQFLQERWPEMRSLLEGEGYRLVDAAEHAFLKQGVSFAYAGIEELTDFAGIAMDEIAICRKEDVTFKLLSKEQYLNVYRASVKDGYRVHERGKKDQEKIDWLENHRNGRTGKQ